MKRLFFFLFFHMVLHADITRLPDEFFIVERFLSLASSFDVLTDLQPICTAHKQLFSLTSSFDIKTDKDKPLATTKAHLLSWGTVADVYDPEGNEIGQIREEIFRIFPWSEYKIYNHEGRIKAIAKMNFLGTEFCVTHPDDDSQVYATISRPLIKIIRDYWTVQINDRSIFEQGIIDPRILIVLAIYQTDQDNRDYYRKLFLDKFRNELELYDAQRLWF